MFRTRFVATLVLAAAATVAIAGCGSQNGGTGGGSGTVSPSTSSATTGATGTTTPTSPSSGTSPGTSSSTSPAPTRTDAADCVSHTELTAADNGRTLCLTTGGQVRLTLDGTQDRPWKPVTVTGDALKAANAGIVILPGDAVAAYDAVARGTAKLSSSRPLCAQPSSPGQMSCQGIEEWTVTVRVR
ncbi:hypothetical protein [Streptomyces sp. NPDC005209]|uniref:hypothetical protein n=1 Tax=Streptomyces sp. NPDC005209 TaxID=3156715 RepID=UPI0033B26E97